MWNVACKWRPNSFYHITQWQLILFDIYILTIEGEFVLKSENLVCNSSSSILTCVYLYLCICVFVYLCSFWKAKTFVAVLVPSALLDRHVQEGVHLSAPCDRYHQQHQQQHHQQHQQLQGWHRDHPQYLITTIKQSWITTWSPAVCPLTETPRKRRERRNGILKRILKDMH